MKATLLLMASVFSMPVASSLALASTIEHELSYGASQFSLVEKNGEIEVGVSGATREFRAGRPDLPILAERVELPRGTRVASVKVASMRTESWGSRVQVPPAVRVRPGLGPIERTAPDPTFYSRAGFQPQEVVELGYQGYERGQTVAYVQVHPVRWDAVSGRLERVTSLRLTLTLEAKDDADMVIRARVVPEWENASAPSGAGRIAASRMVPGDDRQPQIFAPTQLPSVLGSPVAYVIVTSDAMLSEFQRLADWKTQCGVPAVVRTVSFIRQEYPMGADDADRIRLFLRDAYARWGTKWVLLGGDTDIIPVRYSYTTFYGGEYIAADMYYSCLDGNWNADRDSIYGEGYLNGDSPGDNADLLPEVFVGRAPVVTLAQAQLFVNKTLQYTKTPLGDYERRVLFFAEVLFPQDWQQGQPTSLDGAELVEECLPSIRTKPWIHYARLYENYLDPRWEPGAVQETRARVVDSLNVGYNVACHVGHGFRNVMSCADDNLGDSDVLNLSNGNRVFNLYASNCTSNAIDFACIGESFLLAVNGGAVTNIGSSRFDFPTAGRQFQREYYRLVFEDDVTAVGEAQARAKIPYVAFSTYDGVNRWTEMTLLLLGDPELHIWTDTPKTLAVSHPASISVGDTTFTVNVQTGGQPLAGALVTAYRPNDDYRSVLTNASGNAVMDFRPDSVGTMTLTVTGTNCRPYQATMNITSSGAALLRESALTIDDDSVSGTIGNNNGLLDAGETVDIRIAIRNQGGASASNVTGLLRTTDPLVTISDSTVAYGTVASNTTSNPNDWYRISVPFTAADQREIPFTLRITIPGGRSFFEPMRLVLRAPELRNSVFLVQDVGGNSNGRPDPGETVTYTLKLRNIGTGAAGSVTAILRRLDTNSNVTDSTTSFGTIAPGQEPSGDPLVFTCNSTAAMFQLRVSNQYGLIMTHTMDVLWPGAPISLAGAGRATSIELKWAHNTEPDIRGYNTYRSTAEGGPYTKVNMVPTDPTSYYLDEGLAPLTRYYYKVTAVDFSGNESGQSAFTSASTNPPLHLHFPIETKLNTGASVAIEHMYQGNMKDIVAGGDVLYVMHGDGTYPVDADGSPLTPADFTTRGYKYEAGGSIANLGNGDFEIVAPSWGTSNGDSMRVFVFNKQGDVSPGWPLVVDAPIWSSVAIGDLNNDGKKELVFGSNGPQVYAMRANGTEWMNGDGNPSTIGVFKTMPSFYNFGTPALVDLDNNGELDIIYGGFDPGQLYAWRPNGTNLPGFPQYIGGTVSASVAVGYLDGASDTQLDIVIASASDSTYVFKADGGRRAGWPQWIRHAGVGRGPSPALADINKDTFLDIVLASPNGLLYVYQRDGTLLPGTSFPVRFSPLTSGATYASPVVADINGDTWPDVVIGDENGLLAGFNHLGQPLAGFPIQTGAEIRGTAGLCDCDGDGLSEIVLSAGDQKIYMWDYDFAFSPAGPPPWPQFHHDARRTGFFGAPVFVDVPSTPVAAMPTGIEFAPPAPNPSRLWSRIAYAIPADRVGADYEVGVYDLQGRRIRVLASGKAQAGRFHADWDLKGQGGSAVDPGVYFVRFLLGPERQSRKLVVMP